MAATRFRVTLEREDGGGNIFLVIPIDVRSTFGRARPAVRVTINGHTWRTTVAVYGGRSLIGLSRANETAARVAGGDDIEVLIESDDEPREVALPPEVEAAFAADPPARARFGAQSFSDRRELVEWINAAKRPETRSRRVADVVARMHGPDAAT